LRTDFRPREKYPASSYATATVTIAGTDRDYTFDPCAGTHGTCPQTIPDAGTVSVTINGTTISVGYGPTSSANIASSLASAVANAGLPITATASARPRCAYPSSTQAMQLNPAHPPQAPFP
jgi:hypothetical protein